MGLMDLFKRKPKAGPELGTIESYVVADNVGVVRLANGTAVRFGLSACKGFEPATGGKVQVQSIEPHPLGGQRVTAMVRDPADTDYERRVEARDSTAVHPPPPPRTQPLARPIDTELLRRLERISAVNAHVRGGQDPDQISLAINLDAEGKIAADRPAMGFRVDVERVGSDQWRLAAGIDDAVASCRFWIDLEVPELPMLDPATFDMNQLPALPMRISKPPDHERNPLARSAFLIAWRVEGGMDSPNREEPLQVDALVTGVGLCRLPYLYRPSRQPEDHWVLLKCNRGDQSFWLGFDPSTGEAEVFPRRGEIASYQLALDFLCTFT